jgi:hypothetical protein
MTSRLSGLHWVRILVAALLVLVVSFLIVFCVIFTYGFALAFQARGAPDQAQIQEFANQIAPWLGGAGTILFTLLAAYLLARRVKLSPQTHGVLVGALVALLNLLFDRSLSLENVVGFILTVGAGWLGGFLASRAITPRPMEKPPEESGG